MRQQSLAMGTQGRGDAAAVTCLEKKRGGGSHLQSAGMRERDKVAAVIHSVWHRERGVGERSEAWLLMRESRELEVAAHLRRAGRRRQRGCGGGV